MRERFSCRSCEAITQPPAPVHVTPRGMFGLDHFEGRSWKGLHRHALLSMIAWIASLKEPFMHVFGHGVAWRDVILGAGGLFLLYKGTTEIHHTVEGHDDGSARKATTLFSAIVQIIILDMVFSLDSVITAVGMADHLPVMVAAVVIAIIVMLVASEPVSAFVNRHPSVKMLALSFIMLIGLSLLADAAHFHIPRGYLYFAISFSLIVECLNLMAGKKRARKLAARIVESGE